jgi:signal transduction histidine kinase
MLCRIYRFRLAARTVDVMKIGAFLQSSHAFWARTEPSQVTVGKDFSGPSPLASNDSAAHRFAGLLHRGRLQRYSLAVLSVAAALGSALLLDHFGFRDATVPLFICASAISSWYGGQGPAVLAVVLCSLVFDFFFVRPLYTFYIAATELPYFIIFALFTLLVSWFARIRRRVEDDLRHTRDELESLNHELAKRSAALEASNKELEAFAYSVSHDLRAPLRHVAGFGELLRNSAGPSLNEKSRRYLTVVLESASRMGTLIDDLLSFSRISRAEAHYSSVSLQQIVQESVAEVRQDASGRNIVWKVEALPEWYGDRSMLRLVVTNLISNAVKFTSTRPESKIEIGCSECKGDEVVLFVRDNGVGFDMKYSDKLFGVFQRLHPQEAFDGTGIGLATVQRIVRRHGGRVWAEGKVEGGATFYFSLSKAIGAN